MDEVNVKEQIRHLASLQRIDSEVYALKKELNDKPDLLTQLQARFEEKKAGLKDLEASLKALQVSRKQLEIDLQSFEDTIAKASGQLSQIKTNKEYTAKITEIEGVKADKSIVEEKILLSYDEGDRIRALIDQEKELLASEEKDYLSRKKEIESSVKEMEGQIGSLESQRREISPLISKEILARYEKILKNKGGLALAPIEGHACGGCYMNVPPQTINEIRKYAQLMSCEICARILYLQDDL